MGKYKFIDPLTASQQALRNFLNKVEEAKANYARKMEEVASDPARQLAIQAGIYATIKYWQSHPDARRRVKQLYSEIGSQISSIAEELARKLQIEAGVAPREKAVAPLITA